MAKDVRSRAFESLLNAYTVLGGDAKELIDSLTQTENVALSNGEAEFFARYEKQLEN